MRSRSSLCSVLVLPVLIIFVEISLQFQVHIGESEEATFCLNRHHYILKSRATCCNMTVIQPGIDISEHWKSCESQGKDDETIMSGTWRIYGCILKAASGEADQITLEKFAELMTQNYSEVWKKPIMEKVASVSKSASYSDMKALNSIRVTYYDIENQVCSGVTTEEVGKEKDCVHWEEENHRGGSCCGKMSYPIDVETGSQGGPHLHFQFPLSPGNCKERLSPILNAMNASITVQNNIALIGEYLDKIMAECDFSCALLELGIIDLGSTKDWDLDKLNIEGLLNTIYPQWISSSAKKEAVDFLISRINANETKTRMMEYKFPDWKTNTDTWEASKRVIVKNITNLYGIKGNASELFRRPFQKPEQTIWLPTMCTIHKEILQNIRLSLYMSCDKETEIKN